jgi:hypothetical protein
VIGAVDASSVIEGVEGALSVGVGSASPSEEQAARVSTKIAEVLKMKALRIRDMNSPINRRLLGIKRIPNSRDLNVIITRVLLFDDSGTGVRSPSPLALQHSSPTSGHSGLTKTLNPPTYRAKTL